MLHRFNGFLVGTDVQPTCDPQKIGVRVTHYVLSSDPQLLPRGKSVQEGNDVDVPAVPSPYREVRGVIPVIKGNAICPSHGLDM